MSGLVLHNYFRSSTSIRLRAALNLKGLGYQYVAHHLRKGEHHSAAYLAINPQGLVPALELDDGTVLTQSLSIIEYLDEVYPQQPLLPGTPLDRARVRALAYAIACEIHPVNNLRVLGYLKSTFGADDTAVAVWFRHWVNETFAPMEKMLAGDPRTGMFCHGDKPGLADLCLFAQVVNNKRFDVDMSPFATIRRIYENCLAVPAFADAMPEAQPDAE
ncbi:maleylpyruvate isomerase [Mesorhizobium albiziae]|uniref:Maleylpyruvate isomerase n=1 Tax=Neomesorhizobium albiziae TaxID=335020 RepID=A0A1I4ETQ6_9HYPH|nr:maleylacetoacetate isomerase [Mesorhizobium albiziae]GLS32671.1 maleylacetoacetate isomerase [Mesorhizobium albiziae]SFL09105.1 maleylpyruvate isomerase [Mesorhizobium albiziae]